jgi:hypothetical protein
VLNALTHLAPRDPGLDLLGGRGAVQDAARICRVDVVGGVDQHLAVQGVAGLSQDGVDGGVLDGQHHDLGGAGGLRTGCVAAARALSGLEAVRVTLWPARVKELASALPTLPEPRMAICMLASSRWTGP